MDAFVFITVWNHIGKKYVIEKLQRATRKFDALTSMGTFCASKKGAMTGSGAIRSSMSMKADPDTTAVIIEATTVGSDH